MSKIDKIKEEIGWLKVAFGLLTAILVSLVGFIATSYKTTESYLIVLALITAVIISFAIIIVNKKAFKKIDELEEL